MQGKTLPKTPEQGNGVRVRGFFAPAALPLLLILLLAVALRVWQLTRDPLWYDEVMYTILCRAFSLDVATARTVRIEPLFYLFLWAWEKMAQGDFWIRLHSVLAGLATVALAYRVGGHMGGRRGAVAFSVLSAAAPFLVFYSRDAKMYSWLALLELALLWFALRFGEKDGGRAHLAAYAVCAVAVVHTHILSGVFLAALNVTMVVIVRMPWRKLAVWCLAQCVVVTACVPYLWMQWRLAAGMQEVVFWVPPPTARSLWVLCGNLFSGYAPGVWPRMTLLALMVLLMTAGVLLNKSHRRWVLVALVTGALNILVFYSVSRYSHWSFFVDRYMIGTLPLWLMAASAGLVALRPAAVRHGLLAVLVGLSLIGLGGLYRGLLSPDMRDHLGVIRSVDTRAMAASVREYRSQHPGESEAVWHTSWETFLTAKWYLPELRHIAVEMDGEMNMAMARDEIACRKEYYEARAVALEPAAAGLDRIWLVVPESEPAIYPRFRGFQAWLEARGECLDLRTYGGHMAPSGLYLYGMMSNTGTSRSALDLPLVTENGTSRMRASVVTAAGAGGGSSQLRISGTGTTPAGLRCTVFTSDCTLNAADFERRLGVKSRWVLQLYRSGPWPRIAFRNNVNQGSPQGDVLTRQVTLAPGEYDVFVERLAGGQGPLDAPLTVLVGAKPMHAGVRGARGGAADWQWEKVGAFTSVGGAVPVSVGAFNPNRKPEVIPVFSELAFVRRQPGAAPMATPVLMETNRPLGVAPVDLSCPSVPQGGGIEWLLATPEQCARLTDRGQGLTLPGSPGR